MYASSLAGPGERPIDIRLYFLIYYRQNGPLKIISDALELVWDGARYRIQ